MWVTEGFGMIRMRSPGQGIPWTASIPATGKPTVHGSGSQSGCPHWQHQPHLELVGSKVLPPHACGVHVSGGLGHALQGSATAHPGLGTLG